MKSDIHIQTKVGSSKHFECLSKENIIFRVFINKSALISSSCHQNGAFHNKCCHLLKYNNVKGNEKILEIIATNNLYVS